METQEEERSLISRKKMKELVNYVSLLSTAVNKGKNWDLLAKTYGKRKSNSNKWALTLLKSFSTRLALLGIWIYGWKLNENPFWR